MKHVSARSSDVRQADAYLNQVGLDTGKIVKFLLEKGYDHPTEFAADQNGRALALTTGYAGGALRMVLKGLQSLPGDQKKVFNTHPPLAERIKRLPEEPATTPPPAGN
jgi:predicted Zn-dependent protease